MVILVAQLVDGVTDPVGLGLFGDAMLQAFLEHVLGLQEPLGRGHRGRIASVDGPNLVVVEEDPALEADVGELHLVGRTLLTVVRNGVHHGRALLEAPDGQVDRVLLVAFVAGELGLDVESLEALREEFGQRDLAHVAFPETGEHVTDVVAEQAVGREQHDLVGLEVTAAVVQQEGDPLENRGGLAGAGDPLDHQQVAVDVADDVVLFPLDGRHDVLHGGVVLLAQHVLQHLVTHGLVGVEHAFDLTVLNQKLAFLQEVGLLGAGWGAVGDFAQDPVIVDTRDWRAPVVDQEVLVVVHERGRPDV